LRRERRVRRVIKDPIRNADCPIARGERGKSGWGPPCDNGKDVAQEECPGSAKIRVGGKKMAVKGIDRKKNAILEKTLVESSLGTLHSFSRRGDERRMIIRGAYNRREDLGRTDISSPILGWKGKKGVDTIPRMVSEERDEKKRVYERSAEENYCRKRNVQRR